MSHDLVNWLMRKRRTLPSGVLLDNIEIDCAPYVTRHLSEALKTSSMMIRTGYSGAISSKVTNGNLYICAV